MIGGALSRLGSFAADPFGGECVRFMPSYLRNSRLCWRSLHLAHVPMVHCGHLTIVPGRDCIPTHFGDNAAVSGITSPIDAAALLETLKFGGISLTGLRLTLARGGAIRTAATTSDGVSLIRRQRRSSEANSYADEIGGLQHKFTGWGAESAFSSL